MTALLIDLDGVLYETDEPLPGAAPTIQWLREQGVPHVFLMNPTSRPRAAIVEKLAGMNIDVTVADVLTPPVAAAEWLAEVVVGDYGERWTFAEPNRAFRLLQDWRLRAEMTRNVCRNNRRRSDSHSFLPNEAPD